MDEPTAAESAPSIRVNGPASPEDVAAIVAVLAASGGEASEAAPPRSPWSSPPAALRRGHEHGPGAWRGTYRR